MLRPEAEYPTLVFVVPLLISLSVLAYEEIRKHQNPKVSGVTRWEHYPKAILGIGIVLLPIGLTIIGLSWDNSDRLVLESFGCIFLFISFSSLSEFLEINQLRKGKKSYNHKYLAIAILFIIVILSTITCLLSFL